jgi:Zn-dependent protease with chaperone function
VFIYTGLIDLLPEDDTMLAAILSHEIAHVAQRHGVENAGVGW